MIATFNPPLQGRIKRPDHEWHNRQVIVLAVDGDADPGGTDDMFWVADATTGEVMVFDPSEVRVWPATLDVEVRQA